MCMASTPPKSPPHSLPKSPSKFALLPNQALNGLFHTMNNQTLASFALTNKTAAALVAAYLRRYPRLRPPPKVKHQHRNAKRRRNNLV